MWRQFVYGCGHGRADDMTEIVTGNEGHFEVKALLPNLSWVSAEAEKPGDANQLCGQFS